VAAARGRRGADPASRRDRIRDDRSTHHRLVAARVLLGVAAMAVAISTATLRRDAAVAPSIEALVTPQPRLIVVRGVIERPPRMTPAAEGAFAAFAYWPPGTTARLRVEQVRTADGWTPARDRLTLHLSQADARLRFGQRLEAVGWLSSIESPGNPGQFDYAAALRRSGVVGSLRLSARDTWRALDDRLLETGIARLRQSMADHASRSLALGLQGPDRVETLALLDRVLLGRVGDEMGELEQRFRDVGLAHLLAISGAHVGILLFMLWRLGRAGLRRPEHAVVLVLLLLGLYLMVVPLRAPIVRAAIMSAAVFGGIGLRQRFRPLDMLGVAAVVVLLVDPARVLTPGFQLSFGVVLALLRFAGPMSRRMLAWVEDHVAPERGQADAADAPSPWLVGLSQLAAVSVAAFLAAMPLVAWHFGQITPWAAVLSLLATPLLAAMLLLGFVKIWVGLAWPSLGLLLGPAVAIPTELLSGLVRFASSWPSATILLREPPGWGWAVATLALLWAWLEGGFRGRPRLLATAAVLCVAWLTWDASFWSPPAVIAQAWGQRQAVQPRATVNAFDVGEGAATLVRISPVDAGPAAWTSRPETWLVDCGSGSSLDLARRRLLPALHRLGVDRIDTLVLTHADLDHFSGVLDLADHVTIDRVLVPPHLFDAAMRPGSAARLLLRGLRQRLIPVFPIQTGWSARVGAARVTALWPDPDLAGEMVRDNDRSLVLRFDLPTPRGTRRLLLTGDVQGEAMRALMAHKPGAIRADVADLPHHGSFVEGVSPDWLDATRPALVFQSAGWSRLERDRWPDVLSQQGVTRAVTARSGMVTIVIGDDGSIRWRGFRDADGAWRTTVAGGR